MFDGFEGLGVDGVEVVVEVIDGALQAAMAEEGLHGAEVAGVAERGDGGGAAEVVKDDAFGHTESLAELTLSSLWRILSRLLSLLPGSRRNQPATLAALKPFLRLD